jgi:hypothetical protein
LLGTPLRGRTRSRHPPLDQRLERRPKPFVWTKTADQILATVAAYCQRINDSRHWIECECRAVLVVVRGETARDAPPDLGPLEGGGLAAVFLGC